MANQKQIAKDVVQILSASGKFESIILDGSLKLDSWDEISDIDIVVEEKRRSTFENVMAALDEIRKQKEIVFYDWAKSLLPEKYLLSIYLKGIPVFWFVDIACYKDSRYRDISKEEIPQDYAEHLLKLWICNIKHEIRKNQERNKIDIAYQRLFHLSGEGVTAKEKLMKIWKKIPKDSLDNSVLAECEEVLSMIS